MALFLVSLDEYWIEVESFKVYYCAEAVPPLNLLLSLDYSIFVKGDHTNQEIEASVGLEASKLYPDVKYTSVSEYLNQFV